jgi:hypothetical protein
MNATSRVALRWPVLLAGAIAMVAIGAVATYSVVHRNPQTQAGVTDHATSARAGQATVSSPAAASPGTQNRVPDVQRAKVTLTDQGYEPATLSLRAGVPAQITFVRITDKTCGTEVVFPTLKVRRPLPLNQPVTIEFTPAKTGEITFACGMNMLRGRVVVE